DAIANVSPNAARMGVVGRADPVKSAIVFVLIAVNLFPLSVDRPCKRSVAGICRAKIVQGAGSDCRCAGADAHPLEEVAAGYPHHLSGFIVGYFFSLLSSLAFTLFQSFHSLE